MTKMIEDNRDEDVDEYHDNNEEYDDDATIVIGMAMIIRCSATCLPMAKLGNRTKLLFLVLAAVSNWQIVKLLLAA